MDNYLSADVVGCDYCDGTGDLANPNLQARKMVVTFSKRTKPIDMTGCLSRVNKNHLNKPFILILNSWIIHGSVHFLFALS